MKYKINEIFYSIQGEGYWAGRAAIFIRLAGCNLDCSFCDTDFKKKTELTESDIILLIEHYKSDMVVITGGEPTIQDLSHLVNLLKKHNYYVAIESNGTNEFSVNLDWVTISPKKETNLRNIYCSEVKFLVDKKTIDKASEALYLTSAHHYYLQPIDSSNYKENLKLCIDYIKKNPKWKLSTQNHKLWKIQ
jgi:organic radical activating enzyme